MSMRSLINILNERVSISQAYDFLRAQGTNTAKLDDASIKAAVRGKSKDEADKMMRAYAFIKANEPKDARPEPEKMKWVPATKDGHDAPPWAEGLTDWNIRKENYTDANYLRKTIWEVCDKKGVPMSLWIWNGERFTQHIVVLGRFEKHQEMARAMVAYANGTAKAIFLKGKGPQVMLLYNEGRILKKPVAFESKVGSGNLNNDWNLVGNLPRKLADITKQFEHDEDDKAEDYKSWVNVETNKVYAFDKGLSYYDALRRAPKTFGPVTGTLLHMRIHMERAGWCAVGVHSDEDSTGGVVSGMNEKFALKAARMLFRLRYKHGDWNTLKIKTNDTEFTLNNRREIRDYLLKGTKPGKNKDVYL